MPQFISIDPIPPIRGQKMTVCYDFASAEISSTELDIEWVENPTGSCGVALTDDEPCADVDVPDTASGFTITDEVGGSDERIGVVGG